jgi:bifunctional polynucleotide phosphatase/kinase
MIDTVNNPQLRNKMASFDYDWTLVNPKNGGTFPKSIKDWVWLYPEIPKKLKELYEDDYMIVIFTNQSKEWKCQQISLVMKTLEIPVFIVIATEKETYKPNPVLLKNLLGENNIDKDKSFFVGDALGRPTDFSDSDKMFALNIGIKCYSPEDIFVDRNRPFDIPIIPLSDTPEIIIMVGYPGSGKSTIANNICSNEKYIHISGDKLKTTSKMKKSALEHITQSKSIVFDATHSSIKKRKELIDFGYSYKYDIKCIHVTTSMDISFKRNRLREDKKQVPKIAYSVFKKNYEEPSESEGFKLYKV